jgi:hypothetical protein
MSDKNEPAAVGKPVGRTDTTRQPAGTGRASGYPTKSVKLYKASKLRFLASNTKK